MKEVNHFYYFENGTVKWIDLAENDLGWMVSVNGCPARFFKEKDEAEEFAKQIEQAETGVHVAVNAIILAKDTTPNMSALERWKNKWDKQLTKDIGK